jgi:hypothetical protein
MHLTLRPGTNPETLIRNLAEVQVQVSNLYTSGPQDAGQLVLQYLEWANNSTALLTNQISPRDIDRLILTRRHEQILAGVGVFTASMLQRLTRGFVALELRERSDAIHDAATALRLAHAQRVKATQHVVFDTTVFTRYPEKLEILDFRKLTGVAAGAVNLVIPMVVIDELDGLKQHSDKQVRWRAGHSLGVIDGLFQERKSFAVLRRFSDAEADGRPTPEVTVEILFDPSGHSRLPIADDEIIDRALAYQPLAAGPVKLFTYDTGQSTRARNAGLVVEKLTAPLGEEPVSKSERK